MALHFKNKMAVLIALLGMALALPANAADVSGNWAMMVETSAGSGSPSFTLMQKGEVVSGTYKGQLGEAPVTGSVKGNNVILTIKIDAQGQSITMTYTGTLDGNAMSGKVSLGQFGDGTFKGTKQ